MDNEASPRFDPATVSSSNDNPPAPNVAQALKMRRERIIYWCVAFVFLWGCLDLLVRFLRLLVAIWP